MLKKNRYLRLEVFYARALSQGKDPAIPPLPPLPCLCEPAEFLLPLRPPERPLSSEGAKGMCAVCHNLFGDAGAGLVTW